MKEEYENFYNENKTFNEEYKQKFLNWNNDQQEFDRKLSLYKKNKVGF